MLRHRRRDAAPASCGYGLGSGRKPRGLQEATIEFGGQEAMIEFGGVDGPGGDAARVCFVRSERGE